MIWKTFRYSQIPLYVTHHLYLKKSELICIVFGKDCTKSCYDVQYQWSSAFCIIRYFNSTVSSIRPNWTCLCQKFSLPPIIGSSYQRPEFHDNKGKSFSDNTPPMWHYIHDDATSWKCNKWKWDARNNYIFEITEWTKNISPYYRLALYIRDHFVHVPSQWEMTL